MPKIVFCADVGGTKTRLAICSKGKEIKILFLKTYKSKLIRDFKRIIKEFLSEARKRYKGRITNASIAVAGPVFGNKVRPTNLKINIDVNELKKGTGLKRIVLVNDFKAISASIPFLKRKDLFRLKKGESKKQKIKAIIGAGTGLGMAVAIDKGMLFASEGGHIDASAENEFEWNLLNYLKRNVCNGKLPDYETIVSGSGIVNVYRFLQKINYANQKERIKKEIENAGDMAAKISELAIKNKDKICREALRVFLRFYARFARIAALAFLADEVYIAGGIAPKVIRKLRNGSFVKEFKKSYKMEKILKEASIFIIKNENAGLMGAAALI